MIGRAYPIALIALPATRETNFIPDYDALSDETLSRALAIYLCSPANPQGSVLPRETLSKVIARARKAIASGAANVVLVTHGESGRSGVGRANNVRPATSMGGQFEAPYGALAPYASFTTPVLAFMKSRGFTREDLAEVVVSQRLWAMPNERAQRRDPIDVEGVLSARRA